MTAEFTMTVKIMEGLMYWHARGDYGGRVATGIDTNPWKAIKYSIQSAREMGWTE